MHTTPICTFFLKQKCERKHCKFTHPKPTPSKPDKKTVVERNPSGAQNAKKDSGNSDENGNMTSFLEEFTKLQKQLEQRDQMFQERLDKMEKSVARETPTLPQMAAFPPMWPTGQTLQQRMM